MTMQQILVSGGSGDIGSAVCLRLALAGFQPIVGFHRSRETAEDVAAKCGGMVLPLDLADTASVDAAIESLAAEPNALKDVILAASPPPTIEPFGRITELDMIQQWRVNVLGPQRLLAGVVRRIFRKQREGIVVGVLSQAMGGAERPPMVSMGAYVIAKHGLNGMLALAAAEYPWLRVATVSPDFTETKMLNVFDERFLDQMREKQAFRQPAAVADDIVEIIRQSVGNDAG